MNIALQVQNSDFTEAEVSTTVNYALQQESEQARLRLEHYQAQCRSFEVTYDLSSDEFIRQFEAGDLGDDANYFDWYAAKRGLDLWRKRHKILNGVFV